jgi:hypothetical protein
MAHDDELVLALSRHIELVPLRRGWWLAQTVPSRVRIVHPWGRMIGQRSQEGLMIGGGGVA